MREGMKLIAAASESAMNLMLRLPFEVMTYGKAQLQSACQRSARPTNTA